MIALALAIATVSAFADQAADKQECARIGREGLTQYKRADMSRFTAPSRDLTSYPLEMKLAFHVVNHNGGFFSLEGFAISEGQLDDYLENIRKTFRQCGVEVTLEGVYYWQAPSFLNSVRRSEIRSEYLGWEERCLMKPTFRDGAVNVYFIGGVDDPIGTGASHAVSRYWHQVEEAGDERYYGAAFITDYDRAGTAKYTVVPHEVGHAGLNLSHTWGREVNIMSDKREQMGFALNRQQCERGHTSGLLRNRH